MTATVLSNAALEGKKYFPEKQDQNKTQHNTQNRGKAATNVTWNMTWETTWNSLPIHCSKLPSYAQMFFSRKYHSQNNQSSTSDLLSVNSLQSAHPLCCRTMLIGCYPGLSAQISQMQNAIGEQAPKDNISEYTNDIEAPVLSLCKVQVEGACHCHHSCLWVD